MADIKTNISAVENLEKEFKAALVVSIGRLGERGFQLLRKEVPKDTTNLQQGVAPPDVDEQNLTAMLTVSARSARSGGSGTVHYASGKTKAITLKPQMPFNYAEVVAKGRPAIKPKIGKSLIIEVSGAPSDGNFITANGKTYVVRKSAKAQKANPYDERAAAQLEKEAENIVGAVFGEFFNQWTNHLHPSSLIF